MRQEKLDLILTSAMRNNNVDMGIHVVESGKKVLSPWIWADGSSIAFETRSYAIFSLTAEAIRLR